LRRGRESTFSYEDFCVHVESYAERVNAAAARVRITKSQLKTAFYNPTVKSIKSGIDLCNDTLASITTAISWMAGLRTLAASMSTSFSDDVNVPNGLGQAAWLSVPKEYNTPNDRLLKLLKSLLDRQTKLIEFQNEVEALKIEGERLFECGKRIYDKTSAGTTQRMFKNRKVGKLEVDANEILKPSIGVVSQRAEIPQGLPGSNNSKQNNNTYAHSHQSTNNAGGFGSMRVLHASEKVAEALEPRGRLYEDGRKTHRAHWNSKNVPDETNFDSTPRGLYASYLQTCFTNDDLKNVMCYDRWLSKEFYNVMHVENAIERLPTEPELRAELFNVNGSDTFDGLESPFLPRFGRYGTEVVEIVRELDSTASTIGSRMHPFDVSTPGPPAEPPAEPPKRRLFTRLFEAGDQIQFDDFDLGTLSINEGDKPLVDTLATIFERSFLPSVWAEWNNVKNGELVVSRLRDDLFGCSVTDATYEVDAAAGPEFIDL